MYKPKFHIDFPVQAITDRVAKNDESNTETLSTYQNSAHGIYD